MTEQRFIRPNEELSPLAKSFEAALMSVDFSREHDEAAITQAIGEAIREYYCTIECDPRYLAIHIIDRI